MTDFLADRIAQHKITIKGISPYGFGTPGTFWGLPAGWDDVTEAVTGGPTQSSGVMLLSENESEHSFHQNIATYSWVLDGEVPFAAIFTGLEEPTPDEARDVSTSSSIEVLSKSYAQASLTTTFTAEMGDETLPFVSSTVFNWWPLDISGTKSPFTKPSLLIQRTMVAIDKPQDSLPEFRELPHNLDEFTKP